MKSRKLLYYGMLGVICLTLFLPIAKMAHMRRLDDFLITMRYSRNAANGLGAVFNEGAFFQGFTSPLQFLSGIALIKVGFGQESLPSAINIIGLLNLIIIAFCFSLWVNGKITFLPVLTSCTIMLSSMLLTYEACAFDPLWMVGLAVISLTFFRNKKYLSCGIIVGLAVLARHDAGLLVILIGLSLLIQKEWKGLKRFAMAVVLLTVPWYTWAFCYFGRPLPKTLGAKIVQGSSGIPNWDKTFSDAIEITKHYTLISRHQIILKLLILSVLVVGVISYRLGWKDTIKNQIKSPITLFLLFAILQYIAYFKVIKAPAIYPWYHILIASAILMASAYGLVKLSFIAENVVAREIRNKINLRSSLVIIIIIPFTFYAVSSLYLSNFKRIKRKSNGNAQGYRYAGYRAAAEWLNERVSPGDIVRSEEIGVLGWYGNFKIDDMAGLVVDALPIEDSPYKWLVMPIESRFPPESCFVGEASLVTTFPLQGVNISIYKRN